MYIILPYVEMVNHTMIQLNDHIRGAGDMSCKMLESYLMDAC